MGVCGLNVSQMVLVMVLTPAVLRLAGCERWVPHQEAVGVDELRRQSRHRPVLPPPPPPLPPRPPFRPRPYRRGFQPRPEDTLALHPHHPLRLYSHRDGPRPGSHQHPGPRPGPPQHPGPRPGPPQHTELSHGPAQQPDFSSGHGDFEPPHQQLDVQHQSHQKEINSHQESGCRINGRLYSPGQSWHLSDCRRGTCVKFGHNYYVSEDRCSVKYHNANYACVIYQDKDRQYPDCCPYYRCNPEN